MSVSISRTFQQYVYVFLQSSSKLSLPLSNGAFQTQFTHRSFKVTVLKAMEVKRPAFIIIFVIIASSSCGDVPIPQHATPVDGEAVPQYDNGTTITTTTLSPITTAPTTLSPITTAPERRG
jgi:hypothetical protein